MKTFSKHILFLLSLFVLFTACDERDFDSPPIDAPIYEGKANITIQQLKDKYAGQNLVEITEELIVKGIVVANDISGNIYKQIQLQDETAGICIAIDRNNIYGDFRLGQEIFIELKGLYFGLYGNYPQIGYRYSRNNDNVYTIGQATWEFFLERAFLNGFPDPKKAVAKEFSGIDKISASDIGQLVTIHNVYFENGGKEPFAVPNPNNGNVQTESKLLKAAASNLSLTARNSSAANFASQIMPEGIGSITGVLSIFNTTMQITLRDSLDCSFGKGEGNGSKNLPWKIPYALENQEKDLSGWIEGFIVGTIAPGINESNPVKGNDDLIFAAPFLNNTVVLAESADIKDWTKVIIVNLPENSELRTQVNLADQAINLGKKLKVTGNLVKQMGAAGLKVDKGTTDEFVFETGDFSTGGDGSKTSPYSVAEGISKQGGADTLWVKGYIIAAVKSGVTSIQGTDDIEFAAPFTSSTNVLIADSKTETDYSKCLVVNLPSGKPLRGEVNLLDNPENLGKELLVKGKLRAYFGLPGIRDNQGSDFELESGDTPPNPDTILNETLLTQTSFDKFTVFSVTGNEQWTFNASYGAVMSGFADNKSNANEDWFITPTINLSGKTGAKLSFDHARGPAGSINVGIAEKYYTVWISNNYTSGNPTNATWIEITGINHGTTAWAYISSGELSIPASHLTTNTRIAFKYKCTDAESATWEIKNLIIK